MSLTIIDQPQNIVFIRCFNLGSSRLLRQSSTDLCSGKVVIVARRMIPLLWGQWQAHCPSAGRAESQMPSPLSWGIGRAASQPPCKNHVSILWPVFRGVARCCLPRLQGQPQHLKYQNWIKKKSAECSRDKLPFSFVRRQDSTMWDIVWVHKDTDQCL